MATNPPPPAPPGAPGFPGNHPTPTAGRVEPRRGKAALWSLVTLSSVVSIAALVVSIIAITNTGQEPSDPPPGPEASTPAAPILFDDDADRALCEALPELMRESTSRRNAFIATPVDSPERKAAIPLFKTESEDWANRMQHVLAANAEPDRYLTRTLQRYVDDVLLYAQNIYPERLYDKFDDATWNLAIVDYGGALGRCQQLGIRWQ